MFRSERAGLLRPKRLWLGVGWALIGLVPLLAVSIFFTKGATMTLPFYAALLGWLSLSYGMRSISDVKTDEGALEVTEGSIRFAGRELAKRSELRQAFVVPQNGAPLVRLERRGRLRRPHFIRLRDAEEADAFMRALGFDAEHIAAEMKIASSMLAWQVGKQLVSVLLPILLILMTTLLKSVPLLVALSAAYLAYIFALAFAPTTVRVGTDGIVTHWLGRTRFIGHSEIERVARYDEIIGTKRQRGVRLDLKSGEVVRLPTGQREIALTEAAQLERRIDEAREAFRRGATGGTTDILARGDRTAADWIRYLRGVGAGAVGLRAPAIPKEVLLRVVEDSKAAPLERASAAVAAIASGDADVQRRVRVAADTTVSPKLRLALERIASGSEKHDDELLETFAELDAVNEERGAS